MNQFVVVEPDGSHAFTVVGSHDQSIDITPSGDAVLRRAHGDVGDAVQGASAQLMGVDHELGDLLDPVPDADLSVIGVAILGEATPEDIPIAAIDAGRVAHEHVGNLQTPAAG